MKITHLLLTFLLSFGITCLAAAPTAAEPLTLARDGATDHVIAVAADATAVDRYAAGRLAHYLGQMTGAGFALINTVDLVPDTSAIFVGLSAPALVRLGGPDPLADLTDQEHVWRSRGSDVFLYGKGIHGALNAVMAFLEDQLGWRWYSQFEPPVTPELETVTLPPFNQKRGFAYRLRQTALRWLPDFYLQNGFNMGYESRYYYRRHHDFYGESPAQSPYVSPYSIEQRSHTLHRYLPPNEASRYANSFDWLDRQNYFEIHPEWFSLDQHGRRVPSMQVCFANPAMRTELTKNILRHVTLRGDSHMVALTAADYPGKFCHCDDCGDRETRYQSPGGAFYDYLFELCEMLGQRHPGVMVLIGAYRHAQTQVPPTLPPGERLPDNLIVGFAPIEDSVFADWTHPDTQMQETYRDFLEWSKITTHLSITLYPDPFGSGAFFPIGHIERLINTLRLAHAAGATGLNNDNINGYNSRGDFAELMTFLIARLMQDIDADTDALIREFTDHFYGDAATGIRTYLAELEAGRKAMTELPKRPDGRIYSYTTGAPQGAELDARIFPYLTPQNLHRWQGLFDEMETRVAGDPTRLLHVRLARRELDLATLNWWHALRDAYPDAYVDHHPVVERIAWVNNAPPPSGTNVRPIARGRGLVDEYVLKIEAGTDEKPLPAIFDEINPDRIRTFLPVRHRGSPRYVRDPQAATGLATEVDSPNLPFAVQFWQRDHTPSRRGATLALDAEDITPGEFQLLKLGRLELTPSCRIAFGRSHQTHVELGPRFFEPGADNLWDAWVSLKFDGPTYGGDADEDLVVVDRIIMTRVTDSQF